RGYFLTALRASGHKLTFAHQSIHFLGKVPFCRLFLIRANPRYSAACMPEYPDIVVYLEALEKRILGRTLERVDIASPSLLRTAVPPISSVAGRKVFELRRLGKRICFGLEEDLWLVLHLMIAGRLHWK